jgi:putative salt-induced outer membrane protein YdiY
MRYMLLVPLVLFAGAARAQDPAPPAGPVRPWTDVAELGFVMTTGNAEVTNLAFSNKYAYKWPNAEFTFNVAGLRNEATEKSFSNTTGTVDVTETTRTTAEAYTADLKYLRTIHEGFYWYGNAGWLRNEFAGLENRLAGGAGVGYQFFNTETQMLKGEIGAEYVNEEYVGAGQDEFLSARGYLGYEYRFSEKSKFTSDLELWENLDDTDDYRAKLALALISSFTERLALKVSYTVLYDNVPVTQVIPPDPTAPPGTLPAIYEFEKTDTIFATTLVINF